MTASSRAWRFGGGGFRRSEVHALPDGLGDRPRTQYLLQLTRVLDRPVLGAELDDGPGLFRADARQLEQLGGVREIDPHCVRHERLLSDLAGTWETAGLPIPLSPLAQRRMSGHGPARPGAP